jgi:hypothetical protein
MRAALRVLPLALGQDGWSSRYHFEMLMMAVFRANAVSFASLGQTSTESGDSAGRAARDLRVVSYSAPEFAETAARSAAYAADSVHANTFNAAYAGSLATARAVEARPESFSTELWAEITSDLNMPELRTVAPSVPPSLDLVFRPLFPKLATSKALSRWHLERSTLKELNFGLWVDWYERRLAGRQNSFLPQLEGEIEINRRVNMQTDGWWKREPSLVNSDIQAWIDELTPDPIEAQQETAQVRLEIGVQPDWKKPEAAAALNDARQLATQTENELEHVEQTLDQLAVNDDGRLQMGGNHPPEPIDVAAEEAQSQLAPVPISANQASLIKAEVAQARTEVAEVREELAKEEPRVHWLLEKTKAIRETAIALRQLLTDICGEGFTNEFGKWLGTGSALVLVVSAISYALPKAIMDAVLAAL